MSICFVNVEDKDKFDILSSAVGEREALRDFYEQDGVVRPPSLVLSKLNERMIKEDAQPFDFEAYVNSLPESKAPVAEDTVEIIGSAVMQHSNKESLRAMESMSKQLGIEYEIVSQEMSTAMRGSSEELKGFYWKGKVYFVDGLFTADTVFHEFAHPIIQAIALDSRKNNTDLFDNIYSNLKNTEPSLFERLYREVSEGYPENEIGSDVFKEEIIVKAMEYTNAENITDQKSFFGKVFYAIRQWLRKKFGRKVTVGKLSHDTTIKDLVNMLNQGDMFSLEVDILSMDDVLRADKQYHNMMEVIDTKAKEEAQRLINDMSNIAKEQTKFLLQEDSMYSSISEGLINEDNKGILQVLNKSLDILSAKELKLTAVSKPYFMGGLPNTFDAQEVAQKLNSFINDIARTGELVTIFQNKVNALKKADLTKEHNISAVQSISEFSSQWNEAIKKLLATGTTVVNTPLRAKVIEIKSEMDKLKSDVADLRADMVIDVLYDHLSDAVKSNVDFYEEQLARLKKWDAQEEYNRVYAEFYGITEEQSLRLLELERELNKLQSSNKNAKLSPEKALEMDEILTLKLEAQNISRSELKTLIKSGAYQTSFFSRMFDSYSSSQDKVVGGFDSYMRKYMNKISANSNSRQADLTNDLYPLLDKAGWAGKRHLSSGKLGLLLSSVSDIGQIDENGDVVAFQEYVFKSNFKNFKSPLMELSYKISVAQDNYDNDNTDESFNKLMDLEDQLFFFQKNYMVQNMNDAYYENEALLRVEPGKSDPAARMARTALVKFYKEINDMDIASLESFHDYELSEAKNKQWQALLDLRSIYDAKGNLKTGDELVVAERLEEYFKNKYEFFDQEPIEGLFQAAYNEQKKIISDKYKGDVPAEVFEEEMNKWIEHNTVVRVDDNYFKMRSQLLDRRAQILEPLTEVNKNIEDITPLYEKIYKLAKSTRDSSGQYNGRDASKEVQIEIRNLHEQINKAKEDLYSSGGKGLTPAMMKEYFSLYDKISKEESLSSEESRRLDNFKAQISMGLEAFGISPEESSELLRIDEELKGLSENQYTRHYINTMEELIDMNEDSEKVFNEFLDEKFTIEREAGTPVQDNHIRELFLSSNEDVLRQLLETNPDLAEWFLNNHYEVKRSEEATDGKRVEVTVYRNTSLWQYSSPSNTNYYEAFGLQDENGNVTGAVTLNGIPRVPNMNFTRKTEKEEFKTQAIARDRLITAEENGEIINGRMYNEGDLLLANIDNVGNWLPKSIEHGAKDGTYIDDSYMAMFNNERDQWNLLQHVKEWHLDGQEGMAKGQKLYLTYPKVRAQGLEHAGKGYWRREYKRFGDVFRQQSDDVELGLNSPSNVASGRRNFVKSDISKLNVVSRPVTGTYDLPLNEVSTDIIETAQRYSHSLEEFKVYSEMNAFAQSLQFVTSEWTDDVKQKETKNRMKFVNASLPDRAGSQRAQAISNIVDEHFKGHKLAYALPHSKVVNHVMGKAFAWSSRKWFMFNPMSGMTNYVSGNLQMFYKLADSKRFVNAIDLTIGHRKGLRTISEYAKMSYSAKGKSAQMQLMDILDASPDKYLKQQSEAGSRNIIKDLAEGRVGYASRAFSTNQMNYAAMYAILNNKKYKFKMEGSNKKVSLDEVVELVDGRMQTKKGVPEEYSIRYDENGKVVMGAKINKAINLHKSYLSKIHGMGGRQGEGEFFNRYLLGKFVGFLFKFLPGMTMDRYQFRWKKDPSAKGLFNKLKSRRFQSRNNWLTESNELGSIANTIQFLTKLSTGNVKGISRDNITGLIQTGLMYLMSAILRLAQGSILFNSGVDDDDDWQKNAFYYERNNPDMRKMLEKVAGLPDFSWVNPNYKKGGGSSFEWVDTGKLHLLRLLLRSERENNTNMPTRLVPIIYNMAIMKSPSQEGAAKDLTELVALTYDIVSYYTTDEDKYKTESELLLNARDTGPYVFQMEGGSKIQRTVSKFFGLSGSMLFPAKAIDTETSYQI